MGGVSVRGWGAGLVVLSVPMTLALAVVMRVFGDLQRLHWALVGAQVVAALVAVFALLRSREAPRFLALALVVWGLPLIIGAASNEFAASVAPPVDPEIARVALMVALTKRWIIICVAALASGAGWLFTGVAMLMVLDLKRFGRVQLLIPSVAVVLGAMGVLVGWHWAGVPHALSHSFLAAPPQQSALMQKGLEQLRFQLTLVLALGVATLVLLIVALAARIRISVCAVGAACLLTLAAVAWRAERVMFAPTTLTEFFDDKNPGAR